MERKTMMKKGVFIECKTKLLLHTCIRCKHIHNARNKIMIAKKPTWQAFLSTMDATRVLFEVQHGAHDTSPVLSPTQKHVIL